MSPSSTPFALRGTETPRCKNPIAGDLETIWGFLYLGVNAMSTRICRKCHEEKSLSELTKNKRLKDGVDRICKPCTNAMFSDWVDRNKEHYDEWRKGYSSGAGRESRKRRRVDLRARSRAFDEANPNYKKEYNARNRERINAEARERNRKNKTEHNARGMVRLAIRNGTLSKPSGCSSCHAAIKVEAHHSDYTKPLDVAWLCRSCHQVLHGEEMFQKDMKVAQSLRRKR